MEIPPAGESYEVEALRRHLEFRDVPCPSCGYNLRGLCANRCPECNEALSLQVNLSEPRLGAYIGTLAGLAAGGGGCLLWLIGAAYFTARHGVASEWMAVYLYPLVVLAVQSTLVVRLSTRRGRRWFRTLSDQGRRQVVLGAWGSAPLIVIVFLMLLDP